MRKTRLISFILSLLLIISLFSASFCASAAGEYKTWLQSDPRWGSITFGSVGDTMAKSGCAITSIAKLMVHSGAVADDESVFNPGILCNFLKNSGGFTSNGWLYWAKVDGYTSNFRYVENCSLEGMSASSKIEKIRSYISGGYSVVAMVKYGGHYVAIEGVYDGVARIMDSAGGGKTSLFDYDEAGVTMLRIFKGVGSNPPTPSPDPIPVIGGEGTGVFRIRSSDGVNMRSGPGTSNQIVGAVENGVEVRVTERSSNWGKISYNGTDGWICLDFADMVSPNLWKISIASLSSKTEYKVGENFDSSGLSITLIYSDGSQKEISDGFSTDGFSSEAGTHTVRVVYYGLEASFEVKVGADNTYNPGKYAVRSSNGINIRASASIESDVVGGLDDGTVVTVTEISGNWGKISHNGTDGWICLDFAEYTSAYVTGISVSSSRTCFLVGESLDGGVIKVVRRMSDGSEESFDGFSVAGFDTSHTGEITVTVSCDGYESRLSFRVFESVPAGDADFDGNITLSDALLVLQLSVGRIGQESIWISAADLNGDGLVTVADALIVLQMVVGKR